MDKQQAIRDALRGHADGLSKEALRDAVGFSLQGQMRSLSATGEVERTADGYKLNPSFVPGSVVQPPRRSAPAKKKKKARRKPFDAQKLRAIAAKAKAPAPQNIRELAAENYRAVGASLRNHLRENVENIEGDVVMCMLIEQHERAEKIVTAAESIPPR